MNRIILVLILLMAPVEIYADVEIHTHMHHKVVEPVPRNFSVDIKDFHECVSCHDDNQARIDFNACRRELSPENQKLIRTCCETIFDHAFFDNTFCEDLASGSGNYSAVCSNPDQGQEVETCFWKKTNKNADDIQIFRECNVQIMDKYCVIKSNVVETAVLSTEIDEE